MQEVQKIGVLLVALFTIVEIALASTPQKIKISNVRDTQFTVSWITDTIESGKIRYGTNTFSWKIAYDDRGTDTLSSTHHVTVKWLRKNTTYYFDVISGGIKDDNGGVHYTVITGPDKIPSGSDQVSGRVYRQDGSYAQGAIVYLQLVDNDNQGSPGSSALVSVLVDKNGYWFTELVNFRTANLSELFDYSASGDNLWIYVEGGLYGTATQIVDTNNDSPAPDMTLKEAKLPSEREQIYAYPNPAIGDVPITFAGVSHQAKIKIFNLAGELIKVLRNSQRWDGRNDDGKKVVSGVYIYVVFSEQGSKIRKIGKIAIVR